MIGQAVRCKTFVARRGELAVLEDARKALAQTSGSVVLVAGEAGIGKTRLLGEFIGRSGGRARNVLSAECLQGIQQPLGPIRAIASPLAASFDRGALPKTVTLALAQLNVDLASPHALLPSGGFVLERDRLFEALVDFLRRVTARRATILTIEDLHWADDSTRQFIAYLAHHIGSMRLLVVATYRSDELDRDSDALRSLSPLFRERNVRRLVLEPFLPSEIRELVNGALGGRARLPHAVMQVIEQRSEGNPFFAEELVSDYLEHQDLKEAEQRLPISIRATIEQRLAGIDENERHVLEFAAVLGQRFDPAVLAVVMGCDEATIAPALRRARDLGLLVDAGRQRQSYRFRHALTRQTIYEDVPAYEARRLHARILTTLESAPDEAEHLDERAYHAWESGDATKTALYNERAGEAAFSLRALPEAMSCFQRALGAAQESDTRARLLERIGSLERLQGHYQAAVDAFEEAFALRVERREFDAAAMLAASIEGQRYNVGDQTALAFAQGFLHDHGAEIGDAARDHLLVVTARVASAFCDFDSAQRLLDSVAEPAALAPNSKYNYLIVALMRHAYEGNLTQWKRHADQVGQLVPHLGPEAAAGIENALAVTGTYIAANDEIERSLERAERIEREWGFRAQLLYGTAAKGAYLYLRGRLGEARACVEEVAANQDVHPPRRIAAATAAHLAVSFGDESLWTAFDPAILTEARQKLEDPDCVFILGAHGGLLAAKGSLGPAQLELRSAIGTFTHVPPEALFVVLNAARYLPVDELPAIAELTTRAARAGHVAPAALDTLVHAIIAFRSGDLASAKRFGEEAAERYAALGWPLIEALSRELTGDNVGASTIYARCGAISDVRRLGAFEPEYDRGSLKTLSAREQEVANLVARGLRNTEIAARLGVGGKTVEKHLSSVFRKLGVTSRSQVVALVTALATDTAATEAGQQREHVSRIQATK